MRSYATFPAGCAPSILQCLLEIGSDPNVFNQRNQTPFDLAVGNISDCATRLLELFLENDRVDPNAAHPFTGVTSVHLAAANSSNSGPKILNFLLENGGNCDVVDRDKMTPLHHAAKNESKRATEMVDILLNKGADPDAASTTGLTPVHLAAKNKSSSALSILKLLHERGANLNAESKFKTTAVHFAAQTPSNGDVMEFLLDNGGLVNAVDACPEDFTKYNMCDINWRCEELRSSPDGYTRKRTPVHYAAECESNQTEVKILELLLKRGGDPNMGDERKRTAVHLAARNGGITSGKSILKVLLNYNGNRNAVDDQLRTPVHLAAVTVNTYNRLEMMKLLMKSDVDANARDVFGRTPLHYAATNTWNQAPVMIELLLSKKGNPNAVDNSGLTPVDCCVTENQSQHVSAKILELLMKHGGDPPSRNPIQN